MGYKWLFLLILALSFVGFLDATYLTVEHYLGQVPPCSVLSGCEEVTTSRFATVAGVPISLFGAGYFFIIFVFILAYLDAGKRIFFKASFSLAALGFIAALALFYIQFFVLGAVCLYCAVSDIISILIFVLMLFVLKLLYSNKRTE